MKTEQESWVGRLMRNMSCVSADAVEEQDIGNRLYYKTETIFRRQDGVPASRKYKMVTLEMIAEGLSNDTKNMFYACSLTKENVQELHALQQNNSLKYAQYAAYEKVLDGGVALDNAELSRLQLVAQRMKANGKEARYSRCIEELKFAQPEEAKTSYQASVKNNRKVIPVVASVRL